MQPLSPKERVSSATDRGGFRGRRGRGGRGGSRGGRGGGRGRGEGGCDVTNLYMNFMRTCNSVMFYFMKNSFSDVSRKWILPNMIRAYNFNVFLV